MKKFSLLLILMFCWNVYSAWGEFEVNGIYYYVNEKDKTATVTKKPNGYYEGKVVIPESISRRGITYHVTSLDDDCFSRCKGLTSITIPESVTSIGESCFGACTSLTSITIPKSVTSLGKQCFIDCKGLTSITIPESVISLGESCFWRCTGLTSITIPKSVTSLGKSCFLDCTGLTSITIPESVTSLGESCFSRCTGLTSITIPESVTSLGEKCFESCTGLTSITIPESVTSIGESCFRDCTGLTSITIPESVTSLGYDCFANCTGLTSVTIPESVTSLGKSCFYNCTNLTSITIPQSVTSIGKDCFAYGSYTIYCSLRIFNEIIKEYGKRIYLYDAPNFKVSQTKSTQTTISMKIDLREDIDSIPTNSGEFFSAVEKKLHIVYKDPITLPASSEESLVITGLVPYRSYIVYGYVKYSDGSELCIWSNTIDTKGVNPYISVKANSPTAATYTGHFTPGDAHVKEVIVNGETIDPSLITHNGNKYEISANETGLRPNKKITYSFTVRTEEGSSETFNTTVTTPALELTTLQPKCVSSSCAIVAATTNISEEEMNVGFQWKKYDAPESLAPNEAYAAIYDGQLEGYLKNLQSSFYYNVRAFYKAKTGEYYYGDWVTFDPSDFSYFEPTVHTYPATKTTDCTASVRGYVLAGTDDITEQGFEYWETDGPATAERMTKSVQPEAEASDRNVVLATGQVMQVVLDGLKPQTTYIYRAFVRTASGTTYGEEQTFTTDVPTGIENAETEKPVPTIVGYYDLSGRQLAGKQSGLVIVRFSDGTSRKLIVK